MERPSRGRVERWATLLRPARQPKRLWRELCRPEIGFEGICIGCDHWLRGASSKKRQRTAALQNLRKFVRWNDREASWSAPVLWRFWTGCQYVGTSPGAFEPCIRRSSYLACGTGCYRGRIKRLSASSFSRRTAESGCVLLRSASQTLLSRARYPENAIGSVSKLFAQPDCFSVQYLRQTGSRRRRCRQSLAL